MKGKALILDNFHMKIIAMIIMVIDHVAIFFISPYSTLYLPMRIIGRAAFPLFAFMIYEGSVRSRHPWKYILRLSAMLLVVMAGIMITGALPNGGTEITRNVFVDLTAIALTIVLLRQKGYMKLSVVLPVLYVVLAVLLEFPDVIRPDYGIYGLATGLGFYLTDVITSYFSKKKLGSFGIDYEGYKATPGYLYRKNIYLSVYLISVNIVWYIIYLSGRTEIFMPVQSYAILACIPIVFYSQKRGYNAKWFQYGSYLFYPLHLVLLYVISLLVPLI